MRICDLKQKEVINEYTCRRLGCVVDVEMDICTGCIISIIVPGISRLCGLFGRETEYIIPFNCVKQIGDEIILIQVNEEEVLHKCEYI